MVAKLNKTIKIGAKSYLFLFKTAPLAIFTLCIILIAQGLAIPFSVWLNKQIIDLVLSGANHINSAEIVFMVSLWSINALISIAFEPLILFITGNLNEIFTARVGLALMNKANSFSDLSMFENSKFYDNLQLLNSQASYRPLNLIITTVTLTKDITTVIGLFILLIGLAWWLPLIILLCSWPQIYKSVNSQGKSWQALVGGQPEARSMEYFRSLTVTNTYAKEIRLFNLGAFFEEKYKNAFKSLHKLMKNDRKRLIIEPIPAILLSLIGNIFSFWWVISRVITGILKTGDILVLIQSLNYLQQKLFNISAFSGLLSKNLSFFQDFFDFLELKPTNSQAKPAKALDFSNSFDISLRNVSFKYPDGRLAVQNISFTIKNGEKIALVGENGAGKSTLIKLICRLYDPTDGQILINNTDLRDLDIEDWRSNIGTVFQDFGKYQLSIAENIALGDLTQINNDEKIEMAAKLANFHKNGALPSGFQTMLGHQFGGTELSGGQWQKLAIARAFFKDTEILILDEPTSSLDSRSEHEIYEHFIQLTKNKTAILVTHRLSSVQMVDKILVIKDGQLIEQGTHDELLDKNGEYTTLYRLQADKYVHPG